MQISDFTDERISEVRSGRSPLTSARGHFFFLKRLRR